MFDLPEEDLEFLNTDFGDGWEQVEEGDKSGLIIRNYNLPPGYTPEMADLMLLIPAEYPTSGLDMFYFFPEVSRADGFPIGALASETHFGVVWQRWSRHYAWRPGEDSIATHITTMGNVLRSELRGGE